MTKTMNGSGAWCVRGAAVLIALAALALPACSSGKSSGSSSTSFASILLRKEVDVTTAAPGATVTYTIRYANGSGKTVTGTTITDPLPAEVDFVAASPEPTSGTAAVYDMPSHTVTWTIGTWAPGAAEETVTLTVTIKAGTADGTAVVNEAVMDGTDLPGAPRETNSVTTTVDGP